MWGGGRLRVEIDAAVPDLDEALEDDVPIEGEGRAHLRARHEDNLYGWGWGGVSG